MYARRGGKECERLSGSGLICAHPYTYQEIIKMEPKNTQSSFFFLFMRKIIFFDPLFQQQRREGNNNQSVFWLFSPFSFFCVIPVISLSKKKKEMSSIFCCLHAISFSHNLFLVFLLVFLLPNLAVVSFVSFLRETQSLQVSLFEWNTFFTAWASVQCGWSGSPICYGLRLLLRFCDLKLKENNNNLATL